MWPNHYVSKHKGDFQHIYLIIRCDFENEFIPFISLTARAKSFASLKLTKPYPRVFDDLLSRITFALSKEG